jgi:hypothetical protein
MHKTPPDPRRDPGLEKMTVWRIEVRPVDDRHDAVGRARTDAIRSFGFPRTLSVNATRVYFVQASDDRSAVTAAADRLLSDPVAERVRVSSAGEKPPSVRHPAVEVHLRSMFAPCAPRGATTSTATSMSRRFATSPAAPWPTTA